METEIKEDAKTELESSTAQGVETTKSPVVEKTDDKTIREVAHEAAAKAAESSTAEKEKGVQALDETKEKDAKTEVAKKEEPATKVEEKKDESTEQVPFHNHPRWQELQTWKKEVTPLVDQAKAINDYCTKNRISVQELDQSLQIAALVKSDPTKAVQVMNNIVDQLQRTTGEKLPEDLQKDVNDGLMSEARAKEMSKLRAATTQSEHRHQQTEQSRFEAQLQDNLQSLAAWEESQAKNDPAFKDKAEAVQNRFMRMVNEKYPTTRAEVLDYAEKALAAENKHIAKFIPAPPARKQLRSDGSSTTAKTEFKTMRELAHSVADKYRD